VHFETYVARKLKQPKPWSIVLVALTMFLLPSPIYSEEVIAENIPAVVLTPVVNELTLRSISSGNSADKRIALTFDDGPHPVITLKVLEILRARNIKATFFVLGERVKLYPITLQQVFIEGHEVGNHTYTHHNLHGLPNETIETEIGKTQCIVKETIGVEPRLFRPPYGAMLRPESKKFLQQYNLQTILWSVDPRDWKYHNEDNIYNFVVHQARSGSIVLFHDIHPSIIQALPRILDTLLAEGYQFTTVSDLCGLPSFLPNLVEAKRL
jgi:peptidoglycan-N-acetylglucosamine deacetylase